MPRPSPSKVLIVKSSNVTPARISTASTPKSKKAKSPSGTKTKTESSQCSLQQLFLNFSNSPSAASVHCKTCGMSYARGTEPDMSLHEQHHARVTKGIQYRPGSCKEEQILKSYVCRGRGSARMEGCIIVLPPHVRKVRFLPSSSLSLYIMLMHLRHRPKKSSMSWTQSSQRLLWRRPLWSPLSFTSSFRRSRVTTLSKPAARL